VADHLRIDPARALARLFPGRTAAPLSGIMRV